LVEFLKKKSLQPFIDYQRFAPEKVYNNFTPLHFLFTFVGVLECKCEGFPTFTASPKSWPQSYGG
jgi:hypothetical protein